MYYVYILFSPLKNKYYVGQTNNTATRLKSHLEGVSSYTSVTDDWKLVYEESFETRTEAIKRENEIKKKKSRKYIEWLILQSKGD